ncbi:MAG: toprim domain-containing protein [Clostridia bacterium]|nr:toprim domain-containing protein [Clostridia bacterium]
MTEKKQFSDEQIDAANSINIIDYAEKKGYPIKQVTSLSYKIPGYGGLYIHSDGLKWNRFSADIGGGTIQFVMHMENKSWVEAVKELLNIPVAKSPPIKKKTKEKECVNKPFSLPEKNDTNKHIFAYLIGTRKIEKQLVYDLVKQDKIYENKYYNSCVFVGYDKKGEAKFAAVRSTGYSMHYRRDISGSDKSFPFSVEISAGNLCTKSAFSSHHLYVFESPIDLLSYLSLLKLHKIKNFTAYCISLGGVCDLALERFLNEHPSITEITLGLDNDEAGRFACEQIRQKYCSQYKIRRHLPQNKDFNEDLIKMSALIQGEKKQVRKVHSHLARNPPDYEMLLSQ